MPVFPDLEETAVVNPFLVDLLVVSDNKVMPSAAEKVNFKLRPIFVSFPIFERLFFKKRGSTYRRVKLTFLNCLLCKLKPKLVRLLHRYAKTCGESIALTKEIFDLNIDENKCTSLNALTHSEFIRVTDSPNDTFVRTIVNLGIINISVNLTLEFVFRIDSMPIVTPFESDDLFSPEL
jgi:hypothetical protein